MNIKYFTAESREAAEEAAVNYFGREKEDIIFEIVSDDENTRSCQLLAMVGTPQEIANMDAQYGIYYENDGVYLELYKERGAGYTLECDDLMNHLCRKNISDINAPVVQALIGEAAGRSKIANAQNEHIYGESLSIVIAADEQEAEATMLAPEKNGSLLDLDTARSQLNNAGVTHGIDEKALAALIEARDYDQSFIVARATLPVDGEDGKLLFNFSTDERTGSPKEIGRGRVNYRSLDLYVPVEEEQLLVTRVPATVGVPGTSVTGKELKPKTGKEIMLPKGKNVKVNEEKTEMHALCSGMVEFINNSVNVSSVYSIKGDCDISVGDIDFDGSVHISGSVRSGSTIKATGGIVVDGSVEAATIIAGGNVEIKGGVQGADRALIEAGGAVSMLYIEHGTVHADGPVTFDVSLHSVIEAGDSLTAQGRRGAIIGGRVGAAGNIIANYVGTLSNTCTEVAVGVMPRKRTRLQYLEKEIRMLECEQLNLDKLDAYLERAKGLIDSEKWELLHRSSVENRHFNDEHIREYTIEKESLKFELEHATDGKIHVLDTVFSGSRFLIGSDMYMVNDEISYVSFKRSDSNVVCAPCEISRHSH